MSTNEDLEAIITDPGKFEGERVAVCKAYELYLEGMASDDDGSVVTVEVDGTDVHFIEDDNGFISEVDLEPDYERIAEDRAEGGTMSGIYNC